MTDDRRPAADPTRALDAVPAPDQWDEITNRAAHGSTIPLNTVRRGRSRRPLVLAAAAAVVAVAIAGGLVLASRDEGDNDQVVAGPSELDIQEPAGLVGRTWQLTRLARQTGQLTIPAPEQYETPKFSMSDEGQVSFRGCNGASGTGRLEGDRLELDAEWMQTLMACGGAEGEALMAIDEAMGELMRQGPVVELRGELLVLRSTDVEAHFVERPGARPGEPDGGEAGGGEGSVAVVPSGDASCAVGLDPSARPDGGWSVEPGPADPPVVDPDWGAGAWGEHTQGVWNLANGAQRVEVHVPGLMVIDLLGERTEEVLVGENRKAIVWFTDEWVQVRHFGGGTDGGPCNSFTVTATGGTEGENRDTAVAIASALVVRQRPVEDEPADSTSRGDAEPSQPVIPSSAYAEDVDLRQWTGDSGPLLLTAIEVDGVVREAVDTPLGGRTGDGGPIALHARFGEDRVELRSCMTMLLVLDERDGRPIVQLPSGSFGTAGCDGESNVQTGKLAKIISLGPVTRLVDTDDGSFLVLESEEGAAAFRWAP